LIAFYSIPLQVLKDILSKLNKSTNKKNRGKVLKQLMKKIGKKETEVLLQNMANTTGDAKANILADFNDLLSETSIRNGFIKRPKKEK
jgi:hypothetical protein